LFSRRKVIWDRLREIVDAGQTPDAAADQLEQIRKSKSLHQLGKQLKQQRVQGHVWPVARPVVLVSFPFLPFISSCACSCACLYFSFCTCVTIQLIYLSVQLL